MCLCLRVSKKVIEKQGKGSNVSQLKSNRMMVLSLSTFGYKKLDRGLQRSLRERTLRYKEGTSSFCISDPSKNRTSRDTPSTGKRDPETLSFPGKPMSDGTRGPPVTFFSFSRVYFSSSRYS